MLTKPLISLFLAAMAGLFFTLSAEANSRFTVENTTWNKVKVDVFNGDDTECSITLKPKTVFFKKTKTLGCAGGGKGKCKVRLSIKGKQLCKSEKKTCSKSAIKMTNGSYVKITKTEDKYECEFSDTPPLEDSAKDSS